MRTRSRRSCAASSASRTAPGSPLASGTIRSARGGTWRRTSSAGTGARRGMVPVYRTGARPRPTVGVVARRRRPPVAPALAASAGSAAALALLLRPRTGVLAPVPVAVGSYFSEQELRRARGFARPQLALHAARGLTATATLAALARRAPSELRGGGTPAAAALAGVTTSLALEAATLPLTAIARRRALRAGLATDTWRAWAADHAKASAIGAAMAAGGALVADGLQRRAGDRWWLPAAGALVATAAGSLIVGPVVLDPLFNTFTPVPPGQVRDDVLELAAGAGVAVGDVLTVDASRRTAAANAYVTGLGPTKRVVLFDTLIEHFDRDELRLVIAHELAHVRHRDVLRNLAFAAGTAPAALLAVARLAPRIEPGDGPSGVAGLALAGSLVSLPIGLISGGLSRRVEARADTFALKLTGAPAACIAFERRIAVRTLADPDPPRWQRALLGTHPAIVERIGIAEAYAAGAGAAA